MATWEQRIEAVEMRMDIQAGRDSVTLTHLIQAIAGLSGKFTTSIGDLEGRSVASRLISIGKDLEHLSDKIDSTRTEVRDDFSAKLESGLGGVREDFSAKLESGLGGVREEFSAKLESGLGGVRAEIGDVRQEFSAKLDSGLGGVREEIADVRQEMREGFAAVMARLK